MFAPLSRSRLAPQSVCPSCLSTVYSRSNLPRRQIRYNNLNTAAGAPSMTADGEVNLPPPNASVSAQDGKGKRTHPSRKVKASQFPKSTLSPKATALEALKFLLHHEAESHESKSVEKSHKKQIKSNTKKTKSSAGKETQLEQLKDEGGPSDSKLVQPNPKKKRRISTKQKISLSDKEAPGADDDGDEAVSRKASHPTAGEGRIRRVSGARCLSRRARRRSKERYPKPKVSSASESNITLTSSLEMSKKPGDEDSQIKHGDKIFSVHYVKGHMTGCRRPLKTSKAIRRTPSSSIRSRVRRTPSSPKAGIIEGPDRKLISILQREKLGSEEKKRLKSQLRRSILPEPTKTSEARKHGPLKSKSKERPNGAKASKTTKKGASKSLHKQSMEKPGMTAYEIKTINTVDLDLVPIEKPQPPVPSLAYGLERVLFNPGVYHLRDPRSRVFNFDPYLETIMPVADFDFNALKEYITSSRDETLLSAAAGANKKYTGSTSSMTSALAHFHFLLSQWRPVNISTLSQGFPDTLQTFTQLQRAPSAIFLRWRDGVYAIDADKEFDTANILMMLGKSMEKLLTLPTQDFEKYRKANSDQIPEDERNEVESFHYTTMGDFLMRSQLDAHDPRIPGTGMFDLKTRAVVSIRMDARNYHNGLGYEIRSRHGEFESYEREYYDMIRAAFLKYSLQVRMGRMDGIFVAFHNTERIFGFQYISLPEMDLALHGKEDLTIGDSEFKLSLELLNRVLDRATAKFPEQSLRLFFETRDTATPFMYIFAEPVTEDQIIQIQNSKKAEIEEYERTVLGIQREPTLEEIKMEQAEAEWEELQAKVEDSMESDELETLDDYESPDEFSGDRAMIDSDNATTSSVAEAGTESPSEPLVEHLSKTGSEVEHVSKSIAGLGGHVEKQTLHGEASDEADSEKFRDISCTSAEGEEHQAAPSVLDAIEEYQTEEARVDEPSLHNEVGCRQEDANEPVRDPIGDKHSVAEVTKLADANHETSHRDKSKEESKDLLAMTLTIRNKVNGVYVVRPDDIGPDDRWSVEYALAEVPTLEQSRTLYEKTQRRRELILKRDKKDAKSNFHHSYARKLEALSSQGRKWRREQNDIDREKPLKVLGDRIEGTQ